MISHPKPGTKLYRYGLKSSNHLKTADGFMLLEKLTRPLPQEEVGVNEKPESNDRPLIF
ncbi:MAG: hypothetical protein H7222_11290 [Methylotenera sp.]|nr:hypothetical protein [Oligoflexia bacterium]